MIASRRSKVEGFFRVEGKLSVVVTRGWISAWEASRLEPGKTLLGSTLAGEGSELRFNGAFFAQGVLGGGESPPVSAIRVTSLEPPAFEEGDAGRVDDMIEFLPFEVVFGEAAYSLAELFGARPGSILSLDLIYEELPKAELRIAGIRAGAGPVVCCRESLGIRLDEVDPAGFSLPEIRGMNAVISAERYAERKVKLYDWRRPDRFTRPAIAGL
jgi:flagellar motor switch/type III secretory pathway protein FliN